MSQPVGVPFYPVLGETFYPGEEFCDYVAPASNLEDDSADIAMGQVGGATWTQGGDLIGYASTVSSSWWNPRPTIASAKWGLVVRGTGTISVSSATDPGATWYWWDDPSSVSWDPIGEVAVSSSDWSTRFVQAPPEVAALDFPARAQALVRLQISGSVEIDRLFLRIASADGYYAKTGGGKYSEWFPAWDLEPVNNFGLGYPSIFGISGSDGLNSIKTSGPIEVGDSYPAPESLVRGTSQEMQEDVVWGRQRDGSYGYNYYNRNWGPSGPSTGTSVTFNDSNVVSGQFLPARYTVYIDSARFVDQWVNWASSSTNSFPQPSIWKDIQARGKFGIHMGAKDGLYGPTVFYENDQAKMTFLGWTTYHYYISANNNAIQIPAGRESLARSWASTKPEVWDGYATSFTVEIIEGWTPGQLSPSPGDGTVVATFEYAGNGVYQTGPPIVLPPTVERFVSFGWSQFGSWTFGSAFYPLWRSPAWRYWIPEWVKVEEGEQETAYAFWIKREGGEWHPIGTEDLSKLPGRLKLYGPGGWWREFMPGDDFTVRRPLKMLVSEGNWVQVARMIPD